jgi:hypothetical protein
VITSRKEAIKTESRKLLLNAIIIIIELTTLPPFMSGNLGLPSPELDPVLANNSLNF